MSLWSLFQAASQVGGEILGNGAVVPTSLSSSWMVAINPGQPSSAVNGSIGASSQPAEKRPCSSHEPLNRALEKISLLRPVRYLSLTDIFAIKLKRVRSIRFRSTRNHKRENTSNLSCFASD